MKSLSACLIVRDEEKHLAACLESLRPWVDEICVLDTGSTDGTVDLARSLADRVEHFEWGADFASARNAALELATGEWILSVDADEVLDAETGSALRAATAPAAEASSPDVQAWFVTVESRRERGEPQRTLLPRLFRRRPEIRWERPVHESVMASLVALGVGSLQDSGVRLLHSGYTGEAVAKKRVRNLMLLRKRAMEVPDDLYNTYKLAATLRDTQQAAEQLSTYEVAHRLAEEISPEHRAEHPFLPLVYDGFAACLVRAGRLGHARRVLDRGLELFPGCPELHGRRGDLARSLGDAEGAQRHYRACLEASDEVALYAADPAARNVAPHLGLAWLAAERGDTAGALAAVERALADDPEHVEAQCLAVRALLADDDRSEEGLQRLDELMGARPEDAEVRLLAGEVAHARGDSATAADLWRAAALVPSGARARAWLAVAEMGTGSFEAAVEHLPKLADVDLDTAACRVVLSVAAGVPLELDEGLEREELLMRTVPWLRELIASPDQSAARAFAANAPLYVSTLPGIDALLVPEESAQYAPAPSTTS